MSAAGEPQRETMPMADLVSEHSSPGTRKGPAYTSMLVALALLVLWYLIAALNIFPSAVFPSPLKVLDDFVKGFTSGYGGNNLWYQAVISVARILVGFVGGIVVGVPMGILMAESPLIQDAIDPVLQFVRPVPPLAYIPLLVLWFGIGEFPKVLLIFVCTIPILIINTYEGVKGVQRTRVQVAQCLGASRNQIFRHVILPSALPEVFTGMRVGIAIAWTCLVAAEMIAAQAGLGWMTWNAANFMLPGFIFVGIILIGILGYLMDLGIRMLERKVVPWRGHA